MDLYNEANHMVFALEKKEHDLNCLQRKIDGLNSGITSL